MSCGSGHSSEPPPCRLPTQFLLLKNKGGVCATKPRCKDAFKEKCQVLIPNFILSPAVACPQRLPLSFCSSGLAPTLSSPQDPLLLLTQGREVWAECKHGGLGLAVTMDRQSLHSASMQARCFYQAGMFVFLTNLHVLQVPPQGPGFRKWLANPQSFLPPHQTPCPLLSGLPSWCIWDRPFAASYCLQNAKLLLACVIVPN